MDTRDHSTHVRRPFRWGVALAAAIGVTLVLVLLLWLVV
jgi:hypothetical protein